MRVVFFARPTPAVDAVARFRSGGSTCKARRTETLFFFYWPSLLFLMHDQRSRRASNIYQPKRIDRWRHLCEGRMLSSRCLRCRPPPGIAVGRSRKFVGSPNDSITAAGCKSNISISRARARKTCLVMRCALRGIPRRDFALLGPC